MKLAAVLSLTVLFAVSTHAWDYVFVFFAGQLCTVLLLGVFAGRPSPDAPGDGQAAGRCPHHPRPAATTSHDT